MAPKKKEKPLTIQQYDALQRVHQGIHCPCWELPSDYTHLNKDQKKAVTRWIKARCFNPCRAFDRQHTSNDLRRILNVETGHYLSSGQLKGAMITAGYKPDDATNLEWRFNCRLRKPSAKPTE